MHRGVCALFGVGPPPESSLLPWPAGAALVEALGSSAQREEERPHQGESRGCTREHFGEFS